MTSRERFLKVFNGELPDVAPATFFIVDQGHFITQVYPNLDAQDHFACQLKTVEIQKQLGADVFARMVYDINPRHIHFGGLDVSQQTENWEVTTENTQNGNTMIQSSTIRTPDGTLKQEFSINEIRPNTFMYACTGKPIQSIKDLEIAERHEPGISEKHREKTAFCIQRMQKAIGDDGILGVWAPHGPFNMASMLIEHTEIYALFLTEPEFYERLMHFSLKRTRDYAEAMRAATPDVMCVGGNVAGGFIGRAMWEKYVLPYEKQHIDFCQATGIPAMYHNCGQIMNLVESYKKLDCRIIEPFGPPPLGDADLGKAKRMVGDDYIILGGVDQVNVLQKGSVSDVQRITAETMRTGKPGGRFILQSVDFLEYGTPLENLEAFVETARETGAY